ncbi:MAG: hypothetical protein DRZ82_04455 [Thermoprotei archaeon]|nr:MAG: hypothetical protein DRZ82_04455 [Thermoprotei archaeon]
MYNLRLSLFPSFIYSLFIEVNGKFIKVIGWKKGCWIAQDNGKIYGNCGFSELAYWSGTWFIKYLVNSRDELIQSLFKLYPIGLSISPYDKELLFIPVFLSRATGWETNVLRWCRKLWDLIDTLEDVLKVDISQVGTSFQLKQLKESVKDFIDKVYPVLDEDAFTIRKALLSCRWVGPKVADAYLLFTGIDVSSSPIDIHMRRMARRLGINGIPPLKRMCIRYPCSSCPIRNKCLRYILNQRYGMRAGWLQTVLYLFERDYCKNKRCTSCPLMRKCKEPLISKSRFPNNE